MNVKYFSSSCEPEAAVAYQYLASSSPWAHYMAIPCCGEDQLLPLNLRSIFTLTLTGRLLLTLTINEGPRTDPAYKLSNSKTLQWLQSEFSFHKFTDSMYFNSNETCDILLVDRTGQNCFPEKQGVGLARKIGNDIGAYLYWKGLITFPWLHNSDGDAILPRNYFLQLQELQEPAKIAVVIHQYQHQKHQALDDHWQATMAYELWLRYYVFGLQFSRSPYGFPTIGSILTLNPVAYTSVHGFPRRMAGEDFYLLNKLAKVGKVHYLVGQAVTLNDRLSSRVPFGTGQGTQKIVELSVAGKSFEVYHPQCFTVLKSFLKIVENCIENNSPIPLHEISGERDGIVGHYLNSIKITEAITSAQKRAHHKQQQIAQFHNWFDGFRTLKFIHFLRDKLYGSMELSTALKTATFIPKMVSQASLDEQLQILRQQEPLLFY